MRPNDSVTLLANKFVWNLIYSVLYVAIMLTIQIYFANFDAEQLSEHKYIF